MPSMAFIWQLFTIFIKETIISRLYLYKTKERGLTFLTHFNMNPSLLNIVSVNTNEILLYSKMERLNRLKGIFYFKVIFIPWGPIFCRTLNIYFLSECGCSVNDSLFAKQALKSDRFTERSFKMISWGILRNCNSSFPVLRSFRTIWTETSVALNQKPQEVWWTAFTAFDTDHYFLLLWRITVSLLLVSHYCDWTLLSPRHCCVDLNSVFLVQCSRP